MINRRILTQKAPVVERRPLPKPAPPARAPPSARSTHPAQMLQQRLGNHGTQAFLTNARVGDAGALAANATRGAAPAPKAPAAGAKDQAAATEKHAAPHPRQAIGPAVAAVKQRAGAARQHAPAAAAVGSAQASAVVPSTEQSRAAATATVGGMDDAKAEAVRRGEFKAKLKKAIQDATPQPKSEDEANKVMQQGGAQASAALRGEVGAQKDAAAGPIKSAAATEAAASSQPAPPVTALQVQPPGPPPAPVSAAPVVPAPLSKERLDYSADRAPADRAMAQANVTPAQLQRGNDPAFGATLAARTTAEKHEATAEASYRAQEGKVQASTQGGAQAALAKGLGGIHAGRVGQFGRVGDKQRGTAAKDAARRKEVSDYISGIKDATKAGVEKILAEMDAQAGTIFEAGLKRAEQAYDAAFEDAKGGIGTWLTTWGNDWDKHIAQSLGTARAEYMRQVDVAIEEVADFVDRKLKEAKDKVAAGRKAIDVKVASLEGSLKEAGEQARDAVSAELDTLSQSIDDRRDALVDKLAQQYKDSYDRMSAREEELREANKSLWQRAYDATVGLIKKILEMKDMLLGLLARAATVVSDIIDDPIGFLGNLVRGVMQGLKGFISNIGTHLKKGLMDWIFGALSGAGLKLPDAFDLKGILSIVLQILGLTYANFRSRAVRILGEPVVSAIEKVAEVFKVIATEGIGGLWRFIQEKVSDLKSMVLDAIFDFIKERVIIAGITWIIGLLNPASAFFKACKAIYDIAVFFVKRGAQIFELVTAIVTSLGAIAKGNIAGAATFVENALARAVPVAIGFLAGLLGLGDPAKPVRNTIEKAQSPVNKAMDWVINGAKKLVLAAGKAIKGLFGTKDKSKKDEKSSPKTVKQDLLAVLAEQLTADHTLEEARGIVASVGTSFKPMGVSRVSLAEVGDEGAYAVLVEMSPGEELAYLTPGAAMRKVSVRLNVELSLSPDPKGAKAVFVGTVEDPTTKKKARKDGRGYTFLEAELGIAARRFSPGGKQVGGMVFPEEGGKIQLITWNTPSLSLNAPNEGNTSHAERQFYHWVRNMRSKPEGRKVLARVTAIDAHLRDYSPCGACGDVLIVTGAMFPNVQTKKLTWYKPYSGKSMTHKDTVRELDAAGWALSAPADAIPEGAQQVRLVNKLTKQK